MVHGGPEALEVVDLPEVHAGPGQVRVRIYAAAVNPTDTMARNGSRAEQQKVDPPPYVPGMDAAGIVDEVGDGVSTGVRVGDAVMAMVVPKGSHGAYREQIVLQARAVVPAPAGTTHVEACTLPMNGLTARQSLDLLGPVARADARGDRGRRCVRWLCRAAGQGRGVDGHRRCVRGRSRPRRRTRC